MDRLGLTIHELQSLIKDGKTTPGEIVEDLYQKVNKIDKEICAYVHIDRTFVNAQLDNLKHGPLFGVPVSIKDNICVNGQLTTCASKILQGFYPPYDATVIRRLKDAGAIIFEKTNMDEFAFGSSCETSCYGPTHNPWDVKRAPGGSSGGSAACVAVDEAICALGSDTGGSIRQPAALCGVVGLKPTYGRVSRYGLIAFASSLDQIGPVTKDVRDAAILLKVIAGRDPLDATTAGVPVPDYCQALIPDVYGMKIGVPREFFIQGIDPEVEKNVRNALAMFKKLGASCEEISLPHTEYAVAVYYIIASSEASSNLARFDGVQYGYRTKFKTLSEMYMKTRKEALGPEAKRRILLGTYSLSSGYYDAYYLKAQKVRTLMRDDFNQVFKTYNCIITPTSPTAAFKLGEKTNDPLKMYLSDIYTISANLAGMPAISIPAGFTSNNLPVGLQIIARPFDEETLLKAAYTYEQNTSWHKRKPAI
ncbi:MAG: Asp-tRNA(Asn)/Glu-tRNA(Gln) amidotransferase subunit GatA [Candidatus Omnitrophota bacterium]